MDIRKRRAELETAIEAAWADAAYPGDTNIVVDYSIPPELIGRWCVDSDITDIEELLKGKTWQAAITLFADSYFKDYICWLCPVSYRYYMAALLIGLLYPELGSHQTSDDSFAHSLSPTWPHYGSRDEFLARMEPLDAAQINAVHETLTFLPQEEYDEYDYEFWGNADRWIADFRTSRDIHFDKCANLLPTVNAAWAEVSYPGDDRIIVKSGHDCFRNTEIPPDELKLFTNVFVGKTWEELTGSILTNPYLYGQISWLTSEAYQYYLPAYLTALLKVDLYPLSLQEDKTGYRSSFCLMDKPRFSRNARLERLTLLTVSQREIVGKIVHLFPVHSFSQRDLDFWAAPEAGIARLASGSESGGHEA